MHSPRYVAKDYCRAGQCTNLLRSVTLDEVSQLDRDVLTAFAAIREWKNSFVPINRVPLDVLCLVPTHLASQKDRFRATFVCRHWRRTFLQHGALWSQLYLWRGEVYVKTLLERAKDSALRVFASWPVPVGATALLSPHTGQIRSLNFDYSLWADIRRFSELNSGHFPLLHTLNINAADVMTPSSLSLFSGAVDLQEFQLHLRGSQPLILFVFPNITSFKLTMESLGEFRASHLLDFLEASPMLQTVRMELGVVSFDGIPRDRVVVLPNVESFSLAMSNGEPRYRLTTHISCPSVKHASLTHDRGTDDTTPQNFFPVLDIWNAIIPQYTI